MEWCLANIATNHYRLLSIIKWQLAVRDFRGRQRSSTTNKPDNVVCFFVVTPWGAAPGKPHEHP